MARRSHVPKFGNWDDVNDHMPYTAVFDHARQGRGKPVNPNDPSENPNLQSSGRGNGATGRRSYNPNDPEDTMDSPDQQQQQQRGPAGAARGRRNLSGGQAGSGGVGGAGAASSGPGNGVPPRGPSAHGRRGSRENLYDGNNYSADQSPAHSQGRGGSANTAANRPGAASPAWEARRKSASGEDGSMIAPNTPNRSRLRTPGNNNSLGKEEPPSKGPSAALPKFGAWDAQDPGSGDGFTVIFNNARNEKKTGASVNMPGTPEHKPDLYPAPANVGHQSRHGAKKSWFCCMAPDVKA